MIATTTISVDLVRRGILPVVQAVQNDKNTRSLELSLCANGQEWTPPSDARAVVRYIKPDGRGGEYDLLPDGSAACDITKNVVTVILAPQVLTTAGTVRLNVGLINGTESISTFQIQLNVERNVYAELVDSEDYYNTAWVKTAIVQLQADVADLQYDQVGPIKITSISVKPSVAELGSTVDSVTVTWALNRVPTIQIVHGKPVGTDERSATIPGPFTATAPTTISFAVTAADFRDATDTTSTKINFYNSVYYGPLPTGVLPDSAAILALTGKVQSGKSASIPWTPTTGKRPSYACPSRLGTPKFAIGPNEYNWKKLGTIGHENASGYTEPYDIWQHPDDVTSSMTIVVS